MNFFCVIFKINNLLVVLINFGSHVKNIYDTDFVKNKHIENSITPGMNNASQIPIGSDDVDDDDDFNELDSDFFVDNDDDDDDDEFFTIFESIVDDNEIVDTVFVIDSSSDNFI